MLTLILQQKHLQTVNKNVWNEKRNIIFIACNNLLFAQFKDDWISGVYSAKIRGKLKELYIYNKK